MIPYSDGIPARRFPVVNVGLIVANFAVFLFYELPNGQAAVDQASFYPCDVDNACHLGIPWGVGWITAMFMHAGWDHILGNMLFLAIFGKNVEDAFGRIGYLLFYFAGGFAAMMMQTAMTLLFGTASDAQIPNLGASGAIAAVMGAYFVLYPTSRVRTFVAVVPDQHPGVDLPRRLVPVPVFREQLRAGPSIGRRWQWRRVLRACRWIHLRLPRDQSSRQRRANHRAGRVMRRAAGPIGSRLVERGEEQLLG